MGITDVDVWLDLNILALDTSSRNCSVCLQRESHKFIRRDDASVSHSRHLLALIQQSLDEAELSLEQLDAIAIVKGPGSFTGLRIGIAVAQGLAFAQQIPVIAVSSLAVVAAHSQQVFAQQALSVDAVLATMDARMSELYCSWYDVRGSLPKIIGREWVLNPSELHRVGELHFQEESGLLVNTPVGFGPQSMSTLESPTLLIVGEGLCYRDELSLPFSDWISSTVDLSLIAPEASHVLPLAACAIAEGQSLEAEQLIPSYLRDNVTS
ncbi:MAG: tRNA (adenosine(37)-N6)-threonylcarbamoyltransferase complex dimerization subunit type 1 TsaB [Actinobacteria bacterium TMED172]|nr:tRNA (adenosine(37)-N6)-threonylcarbamoyltransferase complex dimerization subunit type 1 TsaB [Cellvibrionales bacterium]OUW33325.1 MAG: tRNA (adenosine(37)-N6)-threonylcarbamoyltransferase complex dimerization subunit type 1 TsaB [Actinobacteria bacterium TMED172]|tara:strand:+ start:1269 stop:2069 length:801 start_codon:yes stop_codon:yes gene_type:complete